MLTYQDSETIQQGKFAEQEPEPFDTLSYRLAQILA